MHHETGTVVMLGFLVSNWISGHALIISLAFFEALISRVILVSSGYVAAIQIQFPIPGIGWYVWM